MDCIKLSPCRCKLSISIFRRLSLFQNRKGIQGIYRYIFQSPFSGDFLCFTKEGNTCTRYRRSLSISIFRRLSLFRVLNDKTTIDNIKLSISIFRRLSLFRVYKMCWNLTLDAIFQSPFSGDFLCFGLRVFTLGVIAEALSISIFRRLSLFRS